MYYTYQQDGKQDLIYAARRKFPSQSSLSHVLDILTQVAPAFTGNAE